MKNLNARKSATMRWLTLSLLLLALTACARLNEDEWRCTSSGWEKHGNPSAPMPTWPCGGKSETPTPIENPTIETTTPEEKKPEIGGGSTETRNESEGSFESPPGVVEGNIVVDSPKPNELVSFPIKVYGKARVFESQFNWRLLGASGKELAKGMGMANSRDVGLYGPYQFMIDSVPTRGSQVTVEVFDYSAKDGSVQDLVSIPLKLESTSVPVGETRTLGENEIAVKVFFANDKLDPEVTCEKVFPATRIVTKSKSMARVAMDELLKGPTNDEKDQGFSTTINNGVKINRLAIVNGVAQIDFDNQIEYQVGGSCKVGLIRRQIEETLKQYPSVKSVVISVEGRTEDILQP